MFDVTFTISFVHILKHKKLNCHISFLNSGCRFLIVQKNCVKVAFDFEVRMYVTRSYEDIGKHIGTAVLNHMIVMQQLYSNASGHAERSMHYIRERQRNTDTM